jgi:hypothetical protein
MVQATEARVAEEAVVAIRRALVAPLTAAAEVLTLAVEEVGAQPFHQPEP